MKARPVDDSTCLELATGFPDIADLRLWVPEAITSNTGNSAVYPVGKWAGSPDRLSQKVPRENTLGPGNCPKVDENTFECSGIRIPADSPVEWETTVLLDEDHATFTVRLTNLGDACLRKAAGAICLRFTDAGWWSDEATFAISDGAMVSLATLGREAGQPNPFQAYLLKGQTYDHVFYHEFWGINESRLDRGLLVSEHAEAGVCVGIESETAYFMHSNKGNPCTDLMLAFGDIEPQGTAEAGGTVWVRRGLARDLVPEAR